MSEAALYSQLHEVRRLGYNYESLAGELKCKPSLVERYFTRNKKMRQFNRLLIEMAIHSVIKKKRREIEEKQLKIK